MSAGESELSGKLGNPEAAASSPDEDWKEKYPELASSEPPAKAATSSSAMGIPNITLEDTVQVVKEKMWYIGDAALKSVAEVLYGFGISPTVLGYSEEELMEEDEVYGADTYQQPMLKDEVVSKTSFAMRSEERLQRRKAEEQGEDAVDEAEDGGVQFLAPEDGGWRTEEEEVVEFGDDKKDK